MEGIVRDNAVWPAFLHVLFMSSHNGAGGLGWKALEHDITSEGKGNGHVGSVLCCISM